MSTVDDSNITQQPKVRGTGYESLSWPCPVYLVPLFQNEASCKTFQRKMSLNCIVSL